MIRYFSHIAELQSKYGITICIENMAREYPYKYLHTAPYQSNDLHLEKIYEIAKEYDLSITYDTSHTMYAKPQEVEIFKKIFDKVKNIHLSSFYIST